MAQILLLTLRSAIALYSSDGRPKYTKVLKVHRSKNDDYVLRGEKPKSTMNVRVLEYADVGKPVDCPMDRTLDVVKLEIRKDNVIAKQQLETVPEED